MKQIFVRLEKSHVDDEGNVIYKVEGVSTSPKERSEEVKTLEFKAERNWSVGYSARQADSLTERYALTGIYKNGERKIEGTRNNMGADSSYYLVSAKLNGKDVQYWHGYSEFMFNKVLKHLGMEL